jgi:hypothetical protein
MGRLSDAIASPWQGPKSGRKRCAHPRRTAIPCANGPICDILTVALSVRVVPSFPAVESVSARKAETEKVFPNTSASMTRDPRAAYLLRYVIYYWPSLLSLLAWRGRRVRERASDQLVLSRAIIRGVKMIAIGAHQSR